MDNVKKYLKRIVILVTVFMLFVGNTSNAALSAKQQQALVSYTRTFVETGQTLGSRYHSRKNGSPHPSVFGYCVSSNAGYNEPMKLDNCDAPYSNETNKYNNCILFCCASFVGGMYYKALGIDVKSMVSGYRGAGAYMATGRGGAFLDPVAPDDILEPGDALASGAHATLYMGYNLEKGVHEIAETGGKLGLIIRSIAGYSGTSPELRAGDITSYLNRKAYAGATNWQASRIKSGLVDPTRDLDNLVITWPDGLATDVLTGEFLQLPGFTYYGLPLEGEFKGIITIDFTWLIAKLAEILDWLVGLIIYSIKICIIGWIAVIENLLSNAIEGSVGEVTETKSNVIEFLIQSSRTITVENIVYNRVPLFDINFFNYKVNDNVEGNGREKETSNLTGQTVSNSQNVGTTPLTPNSGNPSGASTSSTTNDDSVIMVIKKNIARWYYSFRMIAIIILLLMLLYIVIRMIISTVASDKATYKRMLIDWIVSFIIVFSIQYYMITVITLNERFVSLVEPKSTSYTTTASGEVKDGTHYETTLYEEVRSRAYEIKASRAIAGTIMYGVLVYYAIRYSLIYIKRYLTIMILAIISPFVGLTYSFNKLKDSKKPPAIVSNWFREFTINVFLQTIHAIVYSTMIMTALKLSEGSMAGIILSFVILNFLVDANKILRKILLKKPKSKNNSLDNIVNTSPEMYLTMASATLNTPPGRALKKSVGTLYNTGMGLVGKGVKAGASAIGAAGSAFIGEMNRGNQNGGNVASGRNGTGNASGNSNVATGTGNRSQGAIGGILGGVNANSGNSRLGNLVSSMNSRASIGTRPVVSDIDQMIANVIARRKAYDNNLIKELIGKSIGNIDLNDEKQLASLAIAISNPALRTCYITKIDWWWKFKRFSIWNNICYIINSTFNNQSFNGVIYDT